MENHENGESWRWRIMEMDIESWRWRIMEMENHENGESWRWRIMEMENHGDGESWRWIKQRTSMEI